MKAILLAGVALVLMPCAAQAAEVTITASNKYLYEAEAGTFSDKPVVNADVDFDLGGLPANVWVQAGEKSAQELDLSIAPEWQVGSSTVSVGAAGYFYTEYTPGYSLSFSSSTPAGPVSLDFEAIRYFGSYENTHVSLALSAGSDDGLTGSLGLAHNSDLGGFSAFVRTELPLGDSGFALGLRGYHVLSGDTTDRDETGVVFDLVKRF